MIIPQAKIDSLCQYKKGENIYLISDDTINYRIERGSKVRCKCVSIKIEMSKYFMKFRLSDENPSFDW